MAESQASPDSPIVAIHQAGQAAQIASMGRDIERLEGRVDTLEARATDTDKTVSEIKGQLTALKWIVSISVPATAAVIGAVMIVLRLME